MAARILLEAFMACKDSLVNLIEALEQIEKAEKFAIYIPEELLHPSNGESGWSWEEFIKKRR
jgi:hypothetical protein